MLDWLDFRWWCEIKKNQVKKKLQKKTVVKESFVREYNWKKNIFVIAVYLIFFFNFSVPHDLSVIVD